MSEADREPPVAFEAEDDSIDSGEVAGSAVLRRVELLAGGYGLLGGLAFSATWGWRRGLALTAAAAVSIVALRSLEGVVRRLRAVTGEPAPELGWHYPLRLLLLTGLVFLLVLGWHDGLAMLLGLSAVPLALLVEAALQLRSLSRIR
jgi:hypothetical protein